MFLLDRAKSWRQRNSKASGKTEGQSGFTVIELLIVISIIGIIAAIVFPVFATVREKARQATCSSNLKQLGTAFELYTTDNDDRYPLPGSDDSFDAQQTGPFWDLADPSNGGGINAYVKQRSSDLIHGPTIWLCPDMPDYYETPTTVPGSTVTFKQLTARTYVMNWFLRDPERQPDGTLAYAEDAYPDADPASSAGLFHLVGAFATPLAESHLVEPADTILLFEGVPEKGSTPAGSYFGSSRRSGDFSFQRGYMPSAGTTEDVYEEEGIPTQAWMPDVPWHTAVNVSLYCDGHVRGRPIAAYPWVPTKNDNHWYVQRGR